MTSRTPSKKEELSRIKYKDKSDRATVEQVLDPRTMLIIYKLISKGVIHKINGCVSTGKEANVYHAYNAASREFAVKIFKTSILIFKDRERYVNGEFRFRKGHCKGNPRKMVAMWAEKETRNLKRIKQSGINVPEALELKNNIIIMEFIGSRGKAAPRLRDAEIEPERYKDLYIDLVNIMRKLYQECRLVHADLSEYNILYYNDSLYIIDVSQSIEHDHPMSLEFLRRDCVNVNDYFRRMGVAVFTTKQLFEFITDTNLSKNAIDSRLEKMKLEVSEKSLDEAEMMKAEIDDQVFQDMYIPRSLNEIDLEKYEKNNDRKEDDLYKGMTGLKIKEEKEESIDGEDGEAESENESESGNESEGGEDEEKKKKFDPFDGMSKKERKHMVKDEKKEKRKNKIPKHLKKKAMSKNKK